jgi:hypothetical protein
LRFAAKTGVVRYRSEGGGVTGEVVQFAEHGALSRRELTLGDPGSRSHADEQRIITIVRGDAVTTFDARMRVGVRITQAPASSSNIMELDLRRLDEAGLARFGARKLERRNVAGLECEGFALPERATTVCVHRGLVLALEVGTGEHALSLEATSVKLDVDVHESVFDVPADLRLEQVEGDEAASLGAFGRGSVPRVPRDAMNRQP